jgi:LPXTG-site transpeptidase (sortase) family protein
MYEGQETSQGELFKEAWRYLAAFLGVFFLTVLFFSLVGFIPEARESGSQRVAGSSYAPADAPRAPHGAEEPVRVVIDKIGVDMPVKNPNSTDIETLDAALLSGVVRYPGSAAVGEDATMFLFGHSSYLPVVHNQAFRAFNDIQTLSPGDLIRVRSATREYVYRVATVEEANAADAYVALEKGEKKLVLSTCDSFGKPSDRFIVTALFIGEYPVQES